MLDLRTPLGFLFIVLGAALAGYGAFGDRSIYGRSLGVNVNLWWGLVMLAFGATMRASVRVAGGKSSRTDTRTENWKTDT